MMSLSFLEERSLKKCRFSFLLLIFLRKTPEKYERPFEFPHPRKSDATDLPPFGSDKSPRYRILIRRIICERSFISQVSYLFKKLQVKRILMLHRGEMSIIEANRISKTSRIIDARNPRRWYTELTIRLFDEYARRIAHYARAWQFRDRKRARAYLSR